MKFGCNYSKELIEILHEDKSFCDFIKIGAFGKTLPHLEEAFFYKPLLIHGFGWFERGGMGTIEEMDFDLMNDKLNYYNSPFLGMHALAYARDLSRLISDIDDSLPLLSSQPEQSLLEHMVYIFSQIQTRLSVPLLIENMDFSPFYTYDTTVIETVEPGFLCSLMGQTNTYFLFDLSHAKVSAYQLKMDIIDYIENLPLERIKEIHFSGSFYTKDEGFRDIHGIMNEDDYTIAAYLANSPRIKAAKQLDVVTLEYGSCDEANKDDIIEQMTRLKYLFNDENK